MPEFKYILKVGQVFERLTIVNVGLLKNLGPKTVYCECICGNFIYVTSYALRKGMVKSCGCLHAESAQKQGLKNLKHGGTRRLVSRTPEYEVWCHMKQRCLNPKNPKYRNYGGRNITVYLKWLDKEHGFENFYRYIGPRPSSVYSLDRYPNVNGNYEPGNVRWATQLEQQNNKRNNIHSKDKSEHIRWRKILNDMVKYFLFRDVKHSKYFKYIGCSSGELKKHFKNLFFPGMDWSNYGKGKGKWNIDHINPCYKFDLSKEQDRLNCFNYKNLRPMWATDNLSFARD